MATALLCLRRQNRYRKDIPAPGSILGLALLQHISQAVVLKVQQRMEQNHILGVVRILAAYLPSTVISAVADYLMDLLGLAAIVPIHFPFR